MDVLSDSSCWIRDLASVSNESVLLLRVFDDCLRLLLLVLVLLLFVVELAVELTVVLVLVLLLVVLLLVVVVACRVAPPA